LTRSCSFVFSITSKWYSIPLSNSQLLLKFWYSFMLVACLCVFFSHGSTASMSLGLIIVRVLRLHSDTPHSIELLWISDQPVTETYTWQRTTHRTAIHAFGRIQTCNPSKQVTTDPHLRPCSLWDQQLCVVIRTRIEFGGRFGMSCSS